MLYQDFTFIGSDLTLNPSTDISPGGVVSAVKRLVMMEVYTGEHPAGS